MTMPVDEKIDERVRDQAREWHVVMHSGEVDDAKRREFETWLHADRAHKTAYRAFEQLYRDLDFAMPEAGVDLDALLHRQERPFWERMRDRLPAPAWGGAAAAALVLAVVATLLLPERIIIAPPAGYRTEVAEISEITLEDGSVITLGAKSNIETAFSETARRVNLISGEAFFHVAKDSSRPFYVAADDTLIRVVGTQFDVKSVMDRIHVSVLEGVVEVIKPDDARAAIDIDDVETAPRQVLTAGERIIAARRNPLSEVETVERAEAGSWRQGRLSYEDASLDEIVSDLNRYHKRRIRIASADIGALRTTISFSTTDIGQVLDMVEAIHPVEVDRTQTDEITLRQKRSEE